MKKYKTSEVHGKTQQGTQRGTQFCMIDNDMSSISLEMVIAILPEPILILKSRKLVYEFPGYVSVEEK